MARPRAIEERIVDAALEMAEEVGWEGLRLRLVAQRLGLPLARLRAHYRDLDAVADAWLARADGAMLARSAEAGFAELAPRERLYAAITSWLGALEGHRGVTSQIFRAKLYLGHPHHNVALVLWLSRTVQWLREATLLDASGRRRQVEEVGLSALLIATIADWLRDSSDHQERTWRRLTARLAASDRAMARLWPPRVSASGPPVAGEGAEISSRPSRPRRGRRPRGGSRPSAS